MTDYEVERVVTADGTSLAVRRVPGVGNPVVALHGFTGDGSTMLPLLEASRSGRPVIAIDLIGHGQSDAPEHLEPYSMQSVVDQILSILGPQPVATVHLLGYSMGGRVAFSMAARAPWYFASVTTISATPGIDDPVERAARYDADQARADELESQGLETFIDEWLSLPLFDSYVRGLTADAMAATISQRSQSTPVGLANSLRGTGTGSMPPVWQALAAIRSPVLAIAGEGDGRYVQIAKAVAERAPFARAAVVPGVGHVAHAENCDGVSTIIAQFLEVCENNADHDR